MKQNTVTTRKRARKINPRNLKILEQILMEVSVWLRAKQTITGISDSMGKVLAFSSHFREQFDLERLGKHLE